MTLSEFDLFIQQLPYFYQQHGITNFIPPDVPNEQAYETFQFRAWTSNIKTHRIECVWSMLKHKDLDFDLAFETEEGLLEISKQINPENLFILRTHQFLAAFGANYIGKNYKYEEFAGKLFDDVMNHYLTHEDPNSEAVDNYFLTILMNIEREPLLVMLWKYFTNIKM